MPLEDARVLALRGKLHSILGGPLHCMAVTEVAPEKLRSFAYEDVPTADPEAQETALRDGDGEPLVIALCASAEGRCARHYLIGTISSKAMSQGDFPAVMVRAVKLRSHLDADEQLELWVLLVAPSGTSGSPAWLHAARRFEGNQAFARVLVWLPDQDSVAWDASLQALMDRLHLRPLPDQDDGADGVDLSPLDAVLDSGDLGVSERAAWRTVLLDSDLSTLERAGRLIAALPEGGAS